MAFARRIINLQFQLGKGDFGEAGADTVDLSGLRCSANITKAGSASNANCELRVWGMPLDLMNKLTILNKLAFGQQIDNSVTVLAGDEKSGLAVVFAGTIMEAWADGRNAPDVMFHVSATSGLFQSIKPIPPTSYNGSVDIAQALAGLATQMGLTFENSGVTGQIESPYWPGSVKQQIEKACTAVDCMHVIDDVSRVLAVWPKGQARDGQSVQLSPDSGMVGYPSFTQNGVQITSIFNPSLSFGRKVNVESQFKSAAGEWVVASISHNLDALVPDGEWFTEIECSLIGAPVAIIN